MILKLKRVAWVAWIDIVTLLCSVVYCVWSWLLGSVPRNGGTTIYWLTIFYNDLVFPSMVFLFLGTLILTVIWRLCKHNVGFLVLAAMLILFGSIIPILAGYRHLDRAEAAGHVYYLGVRTDLHRVDDYSLCECDNIGLLCRCRYFFGDGIADQSDRFVVDSITSQLKVQVNNRIRYNVSLQCFYDDGYLLTDSA